MQLIGLDSSKALACELMARIYRHYKQYPEAEEFVQKGLHIGRTNYLIDQTFELWNILGTIQMEMGEYELAEISLKTALGYRGKVHNDQITASTYTEMGHLYN